MGGRRRISSYYDDFLKVNAMYWNWLKGGILLGLCFLGTVALVKPIGVSTQFVIVNGIIAKQFNSELVVKDESAKTGYASSNAYLNKSGGKYAKAVANPLSYGLIFVLCMIAGGFLGRVFQSNSNPGDLKQVPDFHKHRFGQLPAIRYLLSFIGGVVVLWGARLAGGCTSGHMMSGMMQTAVSGYLFALATFAIAVPTSIFLYKR